MADAIVIALLIGAVALAVRSIRREGVTCGGDCGSCAGGCAAPRLRLTRAQKRQLAEIKRKGVQA